MNTPQFNNSRHVVKYEPETWKIVSEVQVESFKWFLIRIKNISELDIGYVDFAWLPSLVVNQTLFEKTEQSHGLTIKSKGNFFI